MKNFIKNLPKAELHLHIEGTLEPELLFEIAHRNNIPIKYKSVDELKKAYSFDCLQDFLDIYCQGAKVLIKERDFYDLTYSYLKKCAEQNVRHTEIMFDPQTHTQRGVAFEIIINGISKAVKDAEEHFNVSALLIMSFLRHLSEEEAFKTLNEALPHKHKITAVGLDSSEKGNPPSKFTKVFEAAIKEGFIPVAHAGEEGDADYIWEAINILNVQRIDHGNNCLQDSNLVQEIINRDLALTICPLSNIALQVVKNLVDHPLKKKIDLGLKTTINSDDPAYFGGHINENYLATQKALDLNKEDLYQLAHNSFQYSFLAKDKKERLLLELEQFYYENNS